MKSFKSHRNKAELVAPARATPRETKALSDLDDFEYLRYLQPMVEFFGVIPAADGQRQTQRSAEPAKVVKEAMAEALVYYYPLAGRLREAPGGKLVVEWTGEGVVFVEAETDVSMDELGNPPLPPYPCVEELMCDVADITDVVGAPLFFMQVTQLRCGGFVIGLHICHTISDGYGCTQFLKAIADLARGETADELVLPVWQRDLLTERIPPHVNPIFGSFLETSSNGDGMLSVPSEEILGQYFLFGPRDIAALRNHATTQSVTTFELLTAVMWRCRTNALGYELHHRARLLLALNARGRWKLIPNGFYGNALFYPMVDATVSDLCGSPLSHTIDLVRQAKNSMTDENMESMVDFISSLRGRPSYEIKRLYEVVDFISSLRGRPSYEVKRLYEVCDIKWFGQDALDFGWAKRISGGIPMVGDNVSSDSVSYHMRCTNGKGENIIAVSMCLPRPAMEKFASELAVWLNRNVRANL